MLSKTARSPSIFCKVVPSKNDDGTSSATPSSDILRTSNITKSESNFTSRFTATTNAGETTCNAGYFCRIGLRTSTSGGLFKNYNQGKRRGISFYLPMSCAAAAPMPAALSTKWASIFWRTAGELTCASEARFITVVCSRNSTLRCLCDEALPSPEVCHDNGNQTETVNSVHNF